MNNTPTGKMSGRDRIYRASQLSQAEALSPYLVLSAARPVTPKATNTSATTITSAARGGANSE